MPSLSSTVQTRHVVSVSLGSDTRDHVADVTLLDTPLRIERRGTNGDLRRARELIRELDGNVDAIGLGGIDLYLVAGGRRYRMREAASLARAATSTPVVDGSGLKDTLERETIRRLQSEGTIDFRGRRVLLVSAVDRFGMAEEFVSTGADVIFGDFLFVLGLPIPMRRLSTLRRLGALILPLACQLPFRLLYPTGERQTAFVESAKHRKFYERADVIAGDFLLIRRYLPALIEGKTVLTNTVTPSDIELLRERGARRLITTTPELMGRSFGTNVMEGVFVALGARTPADYVSLLNRLEWRPRVVELQKTRQVDEISA